MLVIFMRLCGVVDKYSFEIKVQSVIYRRRCSVSVVKTMRGVYQGWGRANHQRRTKYQTWHNNRLTIRHRRYFTLATSVECIYPHWLPKICLRERVDGHRGRGRQMKRWLKFFIKEICNSQGLSLKDAFHTAEDRRKWRSMLRLSGCTSVSPRH